MKNIRLFLLLDGKGPFLEIENIGKIELTALELLVIKKLILDNEQYLLMEIAGEEDIKFKDSEELQP